MVTRASNPYDLRGHWQLHGNMAPSAAFLNGVALSQDIPTAGAARFRIRIKTATNGGTLSAAFLRPDGTTAYTANNPANVTVTGGTETKMDVESHYGEGLLRLTFTPGGDGTFTYVDVSQV